MYSYNINDPGLIQQWYPPSRGYVPGSANDPTLPDDPIDDPADPLDPVDPVDPGPEDPTDPVDPVDPDPEDPTDPEDPVRPRRPRLDYSDLDDIRDLSIRRVNRILESLAKETRDIRREVLDHDAYIRGLNSGLSPSELNALARRGGYTFKENVPRDIGRADRNAYDWVLADQRRGGNYRGPNVDKELRRDYEELYARNSGRNGMYSDIERINELSNRRQGRIMDDILDESSSNNRIDRDAYLYALTQGLTPKQINRLAQETQTRIGSKVTADPSRDQWLAFQALDAQRRADRRFN